MSKATRCDVCTSIIDDSKEGWRKIKLSSWFCGNRMKIMFPDYEPRSHDERTKEEEDEWNEKWDASYNAKGTEEYKGTFDVCIECFKTKTIIEIVKIK